MTIKLYDLFEKENPNFTTAKHPVLKREDGTYILLQYIYPIPNHSFFVLVYLNDKSKLEIGSFGTEGKVYENADLSIIEHFGDMTNEEFKNFLQLNKDSK